MQLLTGRSSIRKNIMELMKAPQSQARKKAIVTISERRNVNLKQAQFLQARSIALSQARKS